MNGYVYLLKCCDTYKIGVGKNVEKRIKQLQTGNADIIYEVNKFPSNYPYKIEKVLHKRYNINNVEGEWFYLTNEQIESFMEDCKILEENFKMLEKSENPYFKK